MSIHLPFFNFMAEKAGIGRYTADETHLPPLRTFLSLKRIKLRVSLLISLHSGIWEGKCYSTPGSFLDIDNKNDYM